MKPYERRYQVVPYVTALMCECGTEMERGNEDAVVKAWQYRCPSCKQECWVAKQYPVLEYKELPGSGDCGGNCTKCACV